MMALLATSAAFAQATKLAWSTAPAGAAPGAVFTTQPIVEAHDASDVLDTSFSGPITVAIKAPTATGGAVLLGTTTMNAAFGQAVFNDLSINLPGNFILQATAPGLAEGDSSINVVTTLAEVWSVKEPTGVDPTVAPDTWQQQRAFAVNMNPGSAYRGTMYVSRRVIAVPTAPEIASTPDVFFWRGVATNAAATPGSGILKTAGPDMAHPDGKFNLTGLTLGGNSMWAIGVAEDDYVYVAGLNSGQLFRFNPDGTGGVLVVATTFGSGQFVRAMTVTGKGAGTTVWYSQGGATTAVEKWTASGPTGDPTSAFTKTKLFDTVETTPNQRWRLVPNSTRDTVYYCFNTLSPGIAKYSITGVKDTSFPVWTLLGTNSLDIDSQDRLLMAAYNTNQGFTAFSARSGQNITNKGDGALSNGGGLLPAILTANSWVGNQNSNGMFVARYSDRHYVWFQNDSGHFGGGATGTYCGLISTDMPAPAPTDVLVANPGTGNSLNISWTAAKDPEVTGYNVYVSTSAGALGSKSNSAPITGTSYVAPGLTSALKYYITVHSVGLDPFTSATYEGANLDQYSGVPQLAGIPDAPTAVTATDTKKGGEVAVGWTTPAQNADFIHIYRSAASGTLGSLVKTISAPTAGAPATWNDTGLTNGVPVYYTVKAANGAAQESIAPAQVTATPTDQTAPTFAGIASTMDYGYPGFRLSWANASDNSAVSYKVYVASSYSGFNLAAPVATTTDTKFDVRDLTVGQTAYVLVKAVDAAGNMDANNAIFDVTPTRVIIDPDQNVPANFEKVNVQPDAAVPALVGSGIGSGKGSAPDLFPTGYAANTYFFNSNDKLGKVLYTVPVNAPGSYVISADWLNNAEVVAPHVRFSVTKPDGTVMPDVFLDETGGSNGSAWNTIASTTLTAGTMTVLADFTTVTDSDPAHIFAAPAIRALIQQPYNIYRAATPPTVDGNVTAAEWAGATDIVLGRPSQSLIPGNWTGPADYTAHVYVKWDASALYLAEIATDDILSYPAADAAHLFQNDALELYVGLDPAADPARTVYAIPGDYQITISNLNDNNVLTPTAYSTQASLSSATRLAIKPSGSGYTMEATIPWSEFFGLPAVPTQDQVIGFNLHGDDNDHAVAQQDSAFSLSTLAGSYANPQAWTTATLKGLPPTAVKGDVNGDGAFSNADVLEAIKIAAGISSVTALQLPQADVAGAGADGRSADGKVDMKDVARLRRALNGKDTL
jgi:hypothetical protein